MAPSPARFAAAEGISVPSRWAALGADRRAVWGRCRGSGREPYDTMVDHAEVAWRCTCPSRVPAVQARLGAARDVGPRPGAGGRRPRRGRRLGRRPRPPGRRSDDPPPAPGGRCRRPAERPDAGDRERPRPGPGRARRPPARRPGRARSLARRSHPHRAGRPRAGPLRHVGHAGRPPRRCPGRRPRQPGAPARRRRRHPARLARARARRARRAAPARPGRPARRRRCPPELADAVATACGWQVRQADVLAGVPDTDTWVVAGRSDTREDRIEVRRIWLHGRSTGRWAMILSFAAYRQSLDSSLAVGTAIDADLHRYPGVGLRALVGTVHGASPPDVVCSPPARTVADACDEIGRAMVAEPWTDHLPATVRATVTRVGGRWVLADDTGALPVAPDAPGLAVVLAASAGAPIDVTVEWTSDGARTAHRPPRRPRPRRRPARRSVLRERGMSAMTSAPRRRTTELLAGARQRRRCSAPTGAIPRHRPPDRSPTSSPTPCGRRRRGACWRPWPPAPSPGGPASDRSRRRRRWPRPRPTAGRSCVPPPPADGGTSSRPGRCSRTNGSPPSTSAGGGCRPTSSSGCSAGTAPTAHGGRWSSGWPGPLGPWLDRPPPGAGRGARLAPGRPAGPAGPRPVLAVSPELVPLLAAEPDAVVTAIAGGLASGAFGPPHRAVLVNFVARCRPDTLAPLAEALRTARLARRRAGPSPRRSRRDPPRDDHGARAVSEPAPSCARTPRTSTPPSSPPSPPPTIGPARPTGGSPRGPSSPTCSAARSSTAP